MQRDRTSRAAGGMSGQPTHHHAGLLFPSALSKDSEKERARKLR